MVITLWRKAQLAAHHLCTVRWPVVITDRAPSVVKTQLNSSFIFNCPIHQSNISIFTQLGFSLWHYTNDNSTKTNKAAATSKTANSKKCGIIYPFRRFLCMTFWSPKDSIMNLKWSEDSMRGPVTSNHIETNEQCMSIYKFRFVLVSSANKLV